MQMQIEFITKEVGIDLNQAQDLSIKDQIDSAVSAASAKLETAVSEITESIIPTMKLDIN